MTFSINIIYKQSLSVFEHYSGCPVAMVTDILEGAFSNFECILL